MSLCSVLFVIHTQKRKKSPEFILLQGNMPLAASPASLVSLLTSLSDRTWGLGLSLQGTAPHNCFRFIHSLFPQCAPEDIDANTLSSLEEGFLVSASP